MSPEALAKIEEACNITISLWVCCISCEILFRVLKNTGIPKYITAVFRILSSILLICASICSLFTPLGLGIFILVLCYFLIFLILVK